MNCEIFECFPEEAFDTSIVTSVEIAQSYAEAAMPNILEAFEAAGMNPIQGSPNTYFPEIFGDSSNIPTSVENTSWFIINEPYRITVFSMRGSYSKSNGVLSATASTNYSTKSCYSISIYGINLADNNNFTIGQLTSINSFSSSYFSIRDPFRRITVINGKLMVFTNNTYGIIKYPGPYSGTSYGYLDGIYLENSILVILYHQSNDMEAMTLYSWTTNGYNLSTSNTTFKNTKEISNIILVSNIYAMSVGVFNIYNIQFPKYMCSIYGEVIIDNDTYYCLGPIAIKI